MSTRPIGTLMKKPARHDTRSAAMPPTTRPTLAVMPPTAPYQPSARLRCGPSAKVVDSKASVDGARIAAPTPCTARAPINPAGESARPIASDAATADQVTGACAQQHQATERERVGVLDPGQAGRGEPQAFADLRQTGDDDRVVGHDHRVARQGDREHEGLVPADARSGGWIHRGRALEAGGCSGRLVNAKAAANFELVVVASITTRSATLLRDTLSPAALKASPFCVVP
jgi:hypothetical protein